MTNYLNERDEHGNLTDFAWVLESLGANGCDCGTDEPGSCFECVCERALLAERGKVEALTAERNELEDTMRRLTERNVELRLQRDALLSASRDTLVAWDTDEYTAIHDCLRAAVAACEEANT